MKCFFGDIEVGRGSEVLVWGFGDIEVECLFRDVAVGLLFGGVSWLIWKLLSLV